MLEHVDVQYTWQAEGFCALPSDVAAESGVLLLPLSSLAIAAACRR
jgi:hypothetical protein